MKDYPGILKKRHLLLIHFRLSDVYSLRTRRHWCQSRSLRSVEIQQIANVDPTEMSGSFTISLEIVCTSCTCLSAASWVWTGVCQCIPFGTPPRFCEVLHLQHQRQNESELRLLLPPPSLPQLSPPTQSTSLSSIGLRVEPGAW